MNVPGIIPAYSMVWAGSNKPELRASIVDFVAKAIRKPGYSFGACKALAVSRDGHPVAGIILHDWSPDARTIELSAASMRGSFLSRRLLRAVAAYVFGQIDCQAVIMRVSEHNAAARRLAEKTGFQGTVVPRLRGPDEAEIVFVLPAEQWRNSRIGRAVEKGTTNGCS